MSVPEQMPIVEYTANGATTRFPITFDLHDVGYLNVFINKELAQIGSYTVENFEAVIFGTAPKDGDEITLIRDTQLDRETNYQTYDNSFRPTAVNYDFDKIWHVLQEQNLIDGKILARLKAEIEWRRTHDFNYDELAQVREKQLFDALKGYTDTLVAAANPGIFQGVIAGVVFAQDGKSIQTHIEDILKQLEVGSSSVTAETARAEVAEQLLGQKITTEENRAKSAEANLQLQISTTANGIKYFETEVALKAFTPTEVDPQQAYAFDTKKNYLWNGSEWKDEGISALDESKKYTDNSFEILEIGINIFDKTVAQTGKYWDYQNGILSDGPSTFSAATKLIVIEPNITYRTSSFNYQQICYFDKNKKYISGKASIVADNFEFTTPVNAKYVALTIETARLDEMMLCKASEFPAVYTPFSLKIPPLVVDTSHVENLFKDVRSDLGVHNVNIFNKLNALNGYYVSHSTGEIGYANNFYASEFIEIDELKEYQFSSDYSQQGVIYDKNRVRISGFAEPPSDKKITTPANAKYIRFTIPSAQINTLVFAESSRFPANFVPFGSVQIDNLIVPEKSNKPTEIWVTFDENSTDPKFKFKGKNAIQRALDSIIDNASDKRYAVRVDKGMDKLTQATDFTGYRGYPSAIVPKDHVDIIGSGEGKTIIWAELPYTDADVGPSIDGNVYPRASYQTLYDYADDCTIKDITFVAKNIRYTNHIDDVRGANKTHKYENVGMIFKGNIGSRIAYGTGTHSGEETYIIGGRSHSDDHIPYACHNNIAFDKPSLWSFKGHNFTSLSGKIAIYQQNDGSLLEDKLKLIGCSFGGAAYRIDYVENWLSANTVNNYDSFNHAEWQITGYGNEPFLFNNEIAGESLRFKTTATGIGNSIRFDKTSSAYSILIKNNHSNTISSLYLNNRVYVDEYIVQDGSVGLSGQAFGCKDLSSKIAAYDDGVNFTSLAKRLGDCSTANKYLVVIVNGTSNTITFNKNYSSMTNVQIIAEMNAQISGATIDLVSYGRDYYPMITDVAETVYNTGSIYIPKGSVVTKVGGSVQLANGNDKVFGIALDDIPVLQVLFDGEKRGQGRLLKCGYIYADRSKAHFVLADSQNPAIGTRFNVNNGQLVTDVNGKISVDIDTGVISINC